MASSEAAKISDYYCEICKDLWVEPVTLPCQHTMCKECYFQNEAANPLQCPFCKKSVRTWTRKAKKENNFVDSKLWEKTRRLFPDEVRKRLEGESIDIPDKELDFSYVQSRQHYGDGELRKEYETERQRQEAELERRRQQEEAASSDLLQTLQKEEEEVRNAEEERRRQEEEDAKFAALLSSQKSPSKFPVPKRTRSKIKATPPIPKDQPILTAAVLTTPKRNSSARHPRSSDTPVFASPSTSSPSTSQRSLQRVVDAVNDRLREGSSSPESSLAFDYTPKSLRRTAIKRRQKADVFDSSDDEDAEYVNAAKRESSMAVVAVAPESGIATSGDGPKNAEDGAFDDISGVINSRDSSSIAKDKTARMCRKPKTKKLFVFEDSSSEDETTGSNESVLLDKKLAGGDAPVLGDSDDKNNNFIREKDSNVGEKPAAGDDDDPVSFDTPVSQSIASDLRPFEGKHGTSPAQTATPGDHLDVDRDVDRDVDLVKVQIEIEDQLRRAREQEEEDRKLALKLQRIFQKEQNEELTKRPEGYGTRSAGSSSSPQPRGSRETTTANQSSMKRTFSTATASSFSRSRSLTTIDKNASFAEGDGRSVSSTPCPHRTSQGSENCSFCILTSPKSGGGRGAGSVSSQSTDDGKGKAGKGLKRKMSSDSSRSKKRKDTV